MGSCLDVWKPGRRGARLHVYLCVWVGVHGHGQTRVGVVRYLLGQRELRDHRDAIVIDPDVEGRIRSIVRESRKYMLPYHEGVPWLRSIHPGCHQPLFNNGGGEPEDRRQSWR